MPVTRMTKLLQVQHGGSGGVWAQERSQLVGPPGERPESKNVFDIPDEFVVGTHGGSVGGTDQDNNGC